MLRLGLIGDSVSTVWYCLEPTIGVIISNFRSMYLSYQADCCSIYDRRNN